MRLLGIMILEHTHITIMRTITIIIKCPLVMQYVVIFSVQAMVKST